MASWFAWRVAPAKPKPPPDDTSWEEDDDFSQGVCVKTAAISKSPPVKTSSPSTKPSTPPKPTPSVPITTTSSTHIGAIEGDATLPTPSAPPAEIETLPSSSSHKPPSLAQQNHQLRTALASLVHQLKQGDTTKIHMHRLDHEIHPEQLMSPEDLQKFIAGLTMLDPTEEKAELFSDDTDSNRSLFVRTQGDSADEQEVAVVDLEDVEWWTLVNPEEDDREPQSVDEKELSDEGYVVLGNDDMRSALAEFIQQTMDRYPESQRLTPDQLKRMLEGTFENLKDPTTMQKMWNMGKMIYTSYGWGTTALAVYNDQRVIRLVASGLFKAATWVLVLLV